MEQYLSFISLPLLENRLKCLDISINTKQTRRSQFRNKYLFYLLRNSGLILGLIQLNHSCPFVSPFVRYGYIGYDSVSKEIHFHDNITSLRSKVIQTCKNIILFWTAYFVKSLAQILKSMNYTFSIDYLCLFGIGQSVKYCNTPLWCNSKL